MNALTTSVTLTRTAMPSLLLPDCFYSANSNAATLELSNFIIQGNSSYPDPLGRLALAISPTPTTFKLSSCTILTDTGTQALVNWNSILSITGSVSTFIISSMSLGVNATIPTFPRPIPDLWLRNIGLVGPLPTTLFDSPTPTISSFHLDADGNNFGDIPTGLFSNINLSALSSLSISLINSKLTGTVPADFLTGSFSVCTEVYVNLLNNALEGPLTNVFASSTFSSAHLASFTLSASSNGFIGPTPTWLNAMGALQTFTLDCYSCRLDTLAPSFFAVSTIPCSYKVSLYDNQFSGNIPSTFFQTRASAIDFDVDLRYNQLTGLPSAMLDSTNFTSATSVSINLASNSLTGNLPNSPGVFARGVPLSLTSYTLDVSSTNLAGTVPPSFLSAFGSTASNATSTISLIVSNAPLSGNLALPDLSMAPYLGLTIEAMVTNFSSLTLPEHATSALRSLSISSSSPLTGQLPTSFFINNPNMIIFDASQSQLNGTMPDMGTSNPNKLAKLVLDSTLMDFCSGARSQWISSLLTICTLDITTAYYCQDMYPTQCTHSAPPPSLAVPPTTSPQAASNPTFPSPTGCSQSTRPSTEWTCIGGTWTFVGSVNSTVIVIPSGATTTTIVGNVTSSTIIINGLNSAIIIDGCTSNTTIIVELTPQQLEEIGRDGKLQQLLSFSNTSMCNSSTSDLNIGTRIKGSSCKTVSVSKVPSSNGSLSGLFQVSRGGCNTWWIILVSVLGGVVLLGIVIAIIACTIHKNRAKALAHNRLRQR